MEHYVEIEIGQPDLYVVKKFLGIRYGVKKIPQPPKKLGLYFDLYAWYLLYKKYNWNFEALQSKSTEELSNAMLFTGAISWLKEQVKVDFSEGDIAAWANEVPAKKMREIGNVLLDSMSVFKDMKEKMAAGESKKKRHGMM